MSLDRISDDEIALKLMRVYKQLQTARDPVVRRSIAAVVDGLIAALKHVPRDESWPVTPQTGAQRASRPRPR